MENFFSVVILIAVCVLILIIYYTLKSLYIRYNERLIKSKIQNKRYWDEKKYIHNYIKSLLQDLESGQLNWIIISSRLNPEAKLEVIYNSVKKCIQIQHRIRKVNKDELGVLKNLGLKTYDIKNDLFCLNVSLNSKIVTDIVYFILEKSSEEKIALNIKIVKSGG